MPDDACRATILVVDDEPGMRSLLLDMLGGFDADLHEAPDGATAAEMLESVRPHVIVTDLMMPRMDGFELCRLAKGNRAIGPVEVIALTGEPSPENVTRIRECGARACLPKPFPAEHLVLEVEAALEAYRSA